MTPRKILGRLVAFAPDAIAADPCVRHPARCVLATAIGRDVLAGFGLAAEPMPVHVTIANAAYLAALDRGVAPATAVVLGGHVMTTRDAPAGPRGWAGHLVLAVPALGVIADLDLRQFRREAKQIVPRPADVFPWPAGARVLDVSLPGGAALRYEYSDDWRFEAAADWCRRERRAPIVSALARAVRAGHL